MADVEFVIYLPRDPSLLWFLGFLSLFLIVRTVVRLNPFGG